MSYEVLYVHPKADIPLGNAQVILQFRSGVCGLTTQARPHLTLAQAHREMVDEESDHLVAFFYVTEGRNDHTDS